MATRCTCFREDNTLRLIAVDPFCKANHLWDEIEALS
jgi:hypothetical protein